MLFLPLETFNAHCFVLECGVLQYEYRGVQWSAGQASDTDSRAVRAGIEAAD